MHKDHHRTQNLPAVLAQAPMEVSYFELCECEGLLCSALAPPEPLFLVTDKLLGTIYPSSTDEISHYKC